jgi:hypothetical protein
MATIASGRGADGKLPMVGGTVKLAGPIGYSSASAYRVLVVPQDLTHIPVTTKIHT